MTEEDNTSECIDVAIPLDNIHRDIVKEMREQEFPIEDYLAEQLQAPTERSLYERRFASKYQNE